MSLQSKTGLGGIVLKKIPYGDRDWIVTLLVDGGQRLSALAPGGRVSQKRFGGALDLFNRLEVHLKSRNNHHVLEEVRLLDGMDGIRRDLKKFAAVCYFSELILEFLHEGESNARLYEVFVQFLESLSGPEAMISKIIPLMEIHCLDIFGFRPVLGKCVSCLGGVTAEGAYHFSGNRGGVICDPCRTRDGVTAKAGDKISSTDYPLRFQAIQEIVRGYQLAPAGWHGVDLAPQDVSEARRAFEYFIQYTAGKPFKSLHFLTRVVP